MQNVIKANFNGTQVQFQSDAYINATSIAKRFKKQPKDYLKSTRTKEYINALINLHKSNRTKILLEENQLVRIKNGSVVNGGGTWLHPKLAIDFARWLSAEFAVWCDEQIEKILHGKKVEQPRLDDLSTSDDRIPLRQAVSKLVSTKGLLYPDAYNIVNQRMGTSHIDEMTISQVEKATDFVHYLMVNNAIEGELMPRVEVKQKDQSAGLALMMVAAKAKSIQDDKLYEVERLLNAACMTFQEAMQCSGVIWDGLYESRARLDFDKETREKALDMSERHFESWKARKSFKA